MRFCFVAVFVFIAVGNGQVCRLSVAGVNQSRRVMGPIAAECPGPFIVHTSPFGNWGVTSNFGPKINGHQFQGWCHDSLTCDNNGICTVNCRDGWYEWNSCTENSIYKAPNCSLYQGNNCTEQVSAMGVNILGTQSVDVPVRCPVDTNGDGTADQGGCKDVTTYSHGANFMSLYELDPTSTDELIQTIYFPPTPVALSCDVLSCPATGSQWAPPLFYQSPSSPAKVYAEMATVVNNGTFVDTSGACRYAAPALQNVNAASFASAQFASGSIASAFGESLAIATQTASSTPLPTSLAGTTVRAIDSSGISRTASLFFVSPHQVNYEMPAGMALGDATVEVRSGNGVVSSSRISVARVAPGVFSANSDGRGVAAAYVVRVKADGSQSNELVFQCGSQAGSCSPVPIDLGVESDRVFLILYATGLRAAGTVTTQIGGIACDVPYAGPQGQYVGLDQVNVLLPQSLRGRGVVPVSLVADGKIANDVTIQIQ